MFNVLRGRTDSLPPFLPLATPPAVFLGSGFQIQLRRAHADKLLYRHPGELLHFESRPEAVSERGRNMAHGLNGRSFGLAVLGVDGFIRGEDVSPAGELNDVVVPGKIRSG